MKYIKLFEELSEQYNKVFFDKLSNNIIIYLSDLNFSGRINMWKLDDEDEENITLYVRLPKDYTFKKSLTIECKLKAHRKMWKDDPNSYAIDEDTVENNIELLHNYLREKLDEFNVQELGRNIKISDNKYHWLIDINYEITLKDWAKRSKKVNLWGMQKESFKPYIDPIDNTIYNIVKQEVNKTLKKLKSKIKSEIIDEPDNIDNVSLILSFYLENMDEPYGSCDYRYERNILPFLVSAYVKRGDGITVKGTASELNVLHKIELAIHKVCKDIITKTIVKNPDLYIKYFKDYDYNNISFLFDDVPDYLRRSRSSGLLDFKEYMKENYDFDYIYESINNDEPQQIAENIVDWVVSKKIYFTKKSWLPISAGSIDLKIDLITVGDSRGSISTYYVSIGNITNYYPHDFKKKTQYNKISNTCEILYGYTNYETFTWVDYFNRKDDDSKLKLYDYFKGHIAFKDVLKNLPDWFKRSRDVLWDMKNESIDFDLYNSFVAGHVRVDGTTINFPLRKIETRIKHTIEWMEEEQERDGHPYKNILYIIKDYMQSELYDDIDSTINDIYDEDILNIDEVREEIKAYYIDIFKDYVAGYIEENPDDYMHYYGWYKNLPTGDISYLFSKVPQHIKRSGKSGLLSLKENLE